MEHPIGHAEVVLIECELQVLMESLQRSMNCKPHTRYILKLNFFFKLSRVLLPLVRPSQLDKVCEQEFSL